MYDFRPEEPADAAAISALIDAAFARAAHADGNEAALVETLRNDGDIALSLVAVERTEETARPIGCVYAFRVVIGEEEGWYGIAPLAVAPDHQRRGIGAALMQRTMDLLRKQGAEGCVLVGDPDYYRRFGFEAGQGPAVPGIPKDYVLSAPLGATITPEGRIHYPPAFGLG
ncbi:GNAT family N-acetyltransferase [Notoacmeibacter ruber]|uniref:N-acetyltransferase n=1 Tax=Notoacmeibacter ruber TaxID=2670375 RepID=A0A3L7JB42_9HYPH|nr:N-acetyltransferase [Notoacmeibacter ruber]RLQ87659.1 N-acetyltransferase [Notoacmeibacter ruber]